MTIPITFFRSSSFTGWDHCQQSWFLTYVLGKQSPSNRAACKGTMVHKALECLAKAKWYKQRNETHFDDDAFGKVFVTDCVPNILIDRAFDFYSLQEKHIEFSRRDRGDVKDWLWKTLNLQGGRFDPRKATIVEPEIHFDFEFPHDWAAYRFETVRGVVEGQLRLKGTSDLVVQISPGVYEVRDYKTGKRLNWSNGKVKTYKHLCKDSQLRIYHYAVSKLFPEIDCTMMTIIYMNDGGSFTVCFDKSDLARTEDMIRRRFERIKSTIQPRLDKGFKCSFCHFNKTIQPNDPKGRTICEFIKDEYAAKGQKFVENNYSEPGFKIGFYAAPGAVA